MKEVKVLVRKGDGDGTLDELFDFLNRAEDEGATHFRFTWSHDKDWDFKFIETFKTISREEELRMEIELLTSELKAISK